jgi:Flp pilus assembly pilin Flp
MNTLFRTPRTARLCRPMVRAQTAVTGWRPVRPRSRNESGQASVEYALVLLGAALVATLLIGWATKTQLLGDLFDHVLSLIRGKAQ